VTSPDEPRGPRDARDEIPEDHDETRSADARRPPEADEGQESHEGPEATQAVETAEDGDTVLAEVAPPAGETSPQDLEAEDPGSRTDADPAAPPAPAEPSLPDADDDDSLVAADRELDQRVAGLTRRGFVTMAVAAATGYSGWRWVDSRPPLGRLPGPLRRGHELNRALWERLFDPERTVPTYPMSRVQTPPVNGRHGLGSDFDPEVWTLRVVGMAGGLATRLTLAQVLSLPAVDLVTELRCIEGWSRIVHWTGVRFADFMAAYPPPTVDGSPPDPRRRPELLVPYVGLETPGRVYYVGLDMASALHSQTLLAWAMNGERLTAGHGAPLRLVVPIKYGIKSIKRIGAIRYSRERPRDFWAERGYDWYSGH